MQAQTSASDQIAKADQLRSQGQPQAAITIIEPMVQAQVNGIADSDLGWAWNVLGSSYQDLEMLDKAKSCYETAIEKLRPISSARAKYAAAIANLGALEGAQGQVDSSKMLDEKANRIYEELGDSGGVTVTATDLATLAFGRRDFKAARRYLARALEESQRTTGLRDDDMAALYSMMGAMALHDGKDEVAISIIQQSIDRWAHAHGPDYYMLGLGYALRAQAIAKSGDRAHALADAQHALALIAGSYGKTAAPYFKVEMVYAQVLQTSGAKEEAARLKKEASAGLADLELRQCNGCTINASGFR
jgi:tetratricopeptide (TPR) repeat protein